MHAANVCLSSPVGKTVRWRKGLRSDLPSTISCQDLWWAGGTSLRAFYTVCTLGMNAFCVLQKITSFTCVVVAARAIACYGEVPNGRQLFWTHSKIRALRCWVISIVGESLAMSPRRKGLGGDSRDRCLCMWYWHYYFSVTSYPLSQGRAAHRVSHVEGYTRERYSTFGTSLLLEKWPISKWS